LRKAKKPIDKISEALRHSLISVTMNHYISGMGSDEIFELKDALIIILPSLCYII
jgi:hypothetical protein